MTTTSFKMSRHFIALVLGVILFSSCKKDKEQEKTDTPAYKIKSSESLFLPSLIDLPPHAAGHTRVMTLYAEGVQKYKAEPKPGTPGEFRWLFVAPQADLFDNTNKKVGTHGAGPYWELSFADSIFAQHFAPAKTAPSPDNSIDWLLLMLKTGKQPTGVFAQVSYIHRIATTGGKAPATPPASASETADVPYTAIYRFIKKN